MNKIVSLFFHYDDDFWIKLHTTKVDIPLKKILMNYTQGQKNSTTPNKNQTYEQWTASVDR